MADVARNEEVMLRVTSDAIGPDKRESVRVT